MKTVESTFDHPHHWERETERVHHYKKECDVIQKADCMSVSVAIDWVWKYFYHKHTLTNLVDRDQSTWDE